MPPRPEMQVQALRTIRVQLQPGEDLRRSVEELAVQQQATGFVLGVVGNLSQAVFQCPGRSQPTVLRGELEIISLQGTLDPEGGHLHLSLSDTGCQVWGGHLEPGSLVLKGVDLLVGLLEIPETGRGGAPATRVEISGAPGSAYVVRAQRMLRTLGIPHRLVKASEGKLEIRIDGQLIGDYGALAELQGRGELEQLRPSR